MKRQAKLIVVLALVLAGAALAYAGASPEGYATVADVMRDPSAHEGKAFQLKASVASVDRANGSFTLADGATLLVAKWDPSVPFPDQEAGGTIEGKNVIVTGVMSTSASGAPVLLASDMKVGCASKYRAA